MKIDEAPPVSTPTGAELLPCSASGAAKRLTAAQIASLAPAQPTSSQIAQAARDGLFSPSAASGAQSADKIPAMRGSTPAVLTAGEIAALAPAPHTDAQIASIAQGALHPASAASAAQGTDRVAALRGGIPVALTAAQIAALAPQPTSSEIASAATAALNAPDAASSAAATDRIPAFRNGEPTVLTAGEIASLASAQPTSSEIAAAASAALFAPEPASAAEATDRIPALRDGSGTVLTLAALASYIASVVDPGSAPAPSPGAAGPLSDSDLLSLVQSGSDALATLAALKTHVLAGVPALLAALSDQLTPSAAAAPYGDHLLLVRTSTATPALYRVSLRDLSSLFSNQTVSGESAPGVLARTETRSVAAQSGSVALDFTVPQGAILRSLRIFVDESISISHLAEDAEDGTEPTSASPLVKLHIWGTDYLSGGSSLHEAGDSKSGVYVATAPSAFTPAVTFLDAEVEGRVYTYAGRVRVSLTWEEPAPLAAIPEEPQP